jgi:hypothetical protein
MNMTITDSATIQANSLVSKSADGGLPCTVHGGTGLGNALYERCLDLADDRRGNTTYIGTLNGRPWCVHLIREVSP